MRQLRTALLAIGMAGFSTSAMAGGYQIAEMGTRASGMGNAFTGVADDASAAWYNPAGAGFSQGSQLMVGADALIVPGAKYSPNASTTGGGGSTQAASKTFFVPHGYLTYMNAPTGLGLTLGVNSPFGLETSWPNNATTGPFRSKTTYSRIKMVMVNPGLVYRINDHFSIAGGADYADVTDVDLNSSNQLLHGKGTAWGGNAALLYRDGDFSLGVNYRSKIKVNLDGSATAQSTLKTLGGTTSSATTSVTLPDQVNVGMAWRPNKQWLLSADVDWVNWKTYDAINITYASSAYRTALSSLQTAVGATATGSTNELRNWKATVAVRLGAEWAYTPKIHTRFGYVFDPTPSNDVYWSPSVPDNNRHVFSFGYSYDFNPQTRLDLLYAWVYFVKREQTASLSTPTGSPASVVNGTYKSQVHIFAASLSYRF